MQSRRSAAGRPTGTDGSDFSYRMVVDSRYTKVAEGKSRLCRLLVIQAVILLAYSTLILFSNLNGIAPEVISSSAVATLFIALLLGESGRRRSRMIFLKAYIVLSTLSTILCIASTIKSGLILQAINGQIRSGLETQKLPLVEAIISFAGLLAQTFAVGTTVALISNMSPPKRSS